MVSRAPAFFQRLARDKRGTSLIEFAFVAPILGLMTVGIADLSQGFSERFQLEAAAHRALERAALGTSETDYQFLQQEAATAANVPLANVTFENWLECNGVKMASYDGACAPGEQVARYIYLRVQKTFVPSFGWTGGTRTISGDAAVRIQ
jgi:hypothetical protein